MRLRHDPQAAPFVQEHSQVWLEGEASAWRGRWRRLFDAKPTAVLALEIGAGRGRFILDSAAAAPDTCFLGLELRAEMVMQAIERVKELPPNLHFLCLNAQLLPELFAPGEADILYINFPDPWPKSRHAKRRLTSLPFLQQYREILSPQGRLCFKTDNRQLFDWSLPNLREAGFELLRLDYQLSEENSGVMTEYERRFRRKGQPICFVEAGRGG